MDQKKSSKNFSGNSIESTRTPLMIVGFSMIAGALVILEGQFHPLSIAAAACLVIAGIMVGCINHKTVMAHRRANLEIQNKLDELFPHHAVTTMMEKPGERHCIAVNKTPSAA